MALPYVKLIPMRIFRFFFIGTLIFLIIFAYSQFIGPGGPKEKERFIIKPDTLQTEVINNLYSQKFLKNKTIFNWILTRRRKSILPGAYLISKSMNAYQLAVALTSFPYQKWVTIPSGIRKEQAALIVSQVLDWSPNKAIEFIKIAQEGWLYPDTYLINTDYDAKQTFQKLFSTFNEKLPPNLQKTLLSQNIRLDTAIKFASLIEREYGSEEDRKIIAGIIWNRLDKDMRLEIDATVQYALVSQNCHLPNPTLDDWPLIADCDFWPHLSGTDIRTTNSPYSTYLNKDLPPGPICTPSIASIRAVAEPTDSEDFYYLHSSDKQIHTARTYQEHLKNIKKYLD